MKKLNTWAFVLLATVFVSAIGWTVYQHVSSLNCLSCSYGILSQNTLLNFNYIGDNWIYIIRQIVNTYTGVFVLLTGLLGAGIFYVWRKK